MIESIHALLREMLTDHYFISLFITNNQNEIPATKMKTIAATLPRIYQNKLGKSIPVYPNKCRRM
jgi:hypothetical protein